MESLQVIEGLSEDLCTVALAHTSDSEADPQPDRDQLLNICRIKEHVNQQLLELQTMLAASDESTPGVTQEDKPIETKKELENEIEFAKVCHQNKTLTLQRIQLAHSIRTKLEENGEDSKLLFDMLKNTLELCSSILSSKEYCRELEDKLIQVRKERLMLKETGQTLSSQIHGIAAKQKEELKSLKNKQLERLQGILQEENKMAIIDQNILQKLVVGSTVNWAQDPKLRDVVLNLGNNIVSF